MSSFDPAKETTLEISHVTSTKEQTVTNTGLHYCFPSSAFKDGAGNVHSDCPQLCRKRTVGVTAQLLLEVGV